MSSKLYSAHQLKLGEQQAARSLGLAMYVLMQRAGQATFDALRRFYPEARNLGVICGGGNNGGDGYVVATLAKQAGMNVRLWHVGDPEKLSGDAKTARAAWRDANGSQTPCPAVLLEPLDVIVDALLGTGLSGPLRPEHAQAIRAMNRHPAEVLSVDIPSGLNADTGAASEVTVSASHTVSFIAHKQGLHSGEARRFRGQLHLDDLKVGRVFASYQAAYILLLNRAVLPTPLLRRHATAHQGTHGKVLILGGDHGMSGAIYLASEACTRSGAGVTKVVTDNEHLEAIATACPEIIVSSWQTESIDSASLFEWADCLVIGPGLGKEGDARESFSAFICQPMNKVVAAGGLDLLAQSPSRDDQRILTPHPDEAAILLGCTVADIEQNRFAAARRLQQKFAGVIVLEGAGILIDDGEHCWVCEAGDSLMTNPAMGDVLSGILGALLAQGLSLRQAALTGVWLHSAAADLAVAEQGEKGLPGSDLFPFIGKLLNDGT